jgi:hypothetical protein
MLWKQFAKRRAFLGTPVHGIGMYALASLLNGNTVCAGDAETPDSQWRGVVTTPHNPPTARRVIFMVMAGGMSHLETFDNKPKLAELHGQPMPESFTAGQPIAQLQGAKLTCFAPQHPFKKCGQSGNEISNIFPQLQTVADELCIVRSLTTQAINHDPAHTFMNTGTTISGRPAMGSWLLYGLGSESADLPGFIVMTSIGGGQSQPIASRQWHSGFLPSRFQGVEFQGKGDPVLYAGNPPGISRELQQTTVDAIAELNRQQLAAVRDPEIATRIAQYELAFRMQSSIPALMDFSDETPETLALYGTQGADGTFGANALLARRLAERGVRFIQLYHRDWDHHGGVKAGTEQVAGLVDRGMMALLTDLKRRDMLKDTLVVCVCEFGRTPMAQGDGRDHHIKGFSGWLAGGGIKPGITWGATDELGYNAVENVVTVHDLHATLLHTLGIDHRRLTYRYQGRDFRLTDVHGEIVQPILA